VVTGVNGFYWACDTFGWLQQYRIPRTAVRSRNSPPLQTQSTLCRLAVPRIYRCDSASAQVMAVPPELLRKTLRDAILGAVVVQFPGALFMFKGFQYFGADIAAPLPPLSTACWQVRTLPIHQYTCRVCRQEGNGNGS
jgi:hypothetical protein